MAGRIHKKIIMLSAIALVSLTSGIFIWQATHNNKEGGGGLKSVFIDDLYRHIESADNYHYESGGRLVEGTPNEVAYKNKKDSWILYDTKNKNDLGSYGEGAFGISPNAEYFSINRGGIGVIFSSKTREQLRAITDNQVSWRADNSLLALQTNSNGSSTIRHETADGQVKNSFTTVRADEIFAVGENVAVLEHESLGVATGRITIFTSSGGRIKQLENSSVKAIDTHKQKLLILNSDQLYLVNDDGDMSPVQAGIENSIFALRGNTLYSAVHNDEGIRYTKLDAATGAKTEIGIQKNQPPPNNMVVTEQEKLFVSYNNKLWQIIKK